MRLWVGFDVGKAFHWVCILDDEGEVLLSRRVEAKEWDIEVCCEEIAALGSHGERRVATDLVGGPATLLEAILLERGERVFHLPGIAVNRARDSGQSRPGWLGTLRREQERREGRPRDRRPVEDSVAVPS